MSDYMTSDGTQAPNPRHLRAAEKHLKRCQRRVSRRKKGSERRKKAVRLLAKAHQQVARQRLDFQHKTALMLLRLFDVIYHEDLRVATMLKNHHLAKSIADAGWAQFLSILAFKAAYAGKLTVAVNPAYTSQVCSGCGVLVAQGLSVRWHACPDCGTSLHRDHNSARNIEGAGQALRGASPVGGA
jgi:putative transposase